MALFKKKQKKEIGEDVTTMVSSAKASLGRKEAAMAEPEAQQPQVNPQMQERVDGYKSYLGSYSPQDFVNPQMGVWEAEVCILLFAIFSELRELKKMAEEE